MQAYHTKTHKLSGTDFHEVHQKAFSLYRTIARKTKRRPYIRSEYFNKQKIFLGLFWHHLYEKSNFRDKVRRMKYLQCAFELIQHSRFEPESKENPNRKGELLHRFAGETPENELFFVQIKEDKHRDQKWLVSVFPLGSK